MSLQTQQCSQCQKIMEADARFCSGCGARLASVAQGSTPAQLGRPNEAQQAQGTSQKKGEAAQSSVTPAASAGLVWRKYEDEWNGFSLERPSGWDVRITNSLITVCQDKTGLTRAVIIPVQELQGKSTSELANEFVKRNRQLNETIKAWKMNAEDVTYHEMQQAASTEQVLLRMQSIEEQQELLGVFSVMVHGNTAIISGFLAPRQVVEKLKPVFQRILASFQAEVRLARTKFVEPSKGAFTAFIPPGWQATGNLVGTSTGEVIRFQASDPDGKMSAEIPARTFLFLEPTRNEFEIRFRAANPQAPKTVAYMPAPLFAERVLAPEMSRNATNFQVESIMSRRDQADALVAQFLEHGQPIPSVRPTFACLQSTFTRNGVPYRQRTYVAVMAPTPAGPAWTAFIGSSIHAPVDLFDQNYMMLEGIVASVQVNKEWSQEQERNIQHQKQILDRHIQQQQINLQQQIAANNQALLQGQMQRNQIMRDAQQYQFNAHQAGIRHQQNTFHQQNQAFVHNYIQGNQYVQNPNSGAVYDVPIGYKNYWINGPGDVVIATDSYYSPGSDFELGNPLKG